MSQDIVERLHEPYWSYGTTHGRMLEAADEITKLRQQRDELVGLVKRYLEETPLGHQPHMIAHIAEAALAKIESTYTSAQGEK